MPKSKLEEIHYNRFYEVVENPLNKVWDITRLSERINKMLPSNITLTEKGLRMLISHQQRFHIFKCRNIKLGKTTTYYIFRKCLPIEN